MTVLAIILIAIMGISLLVIAYVLGQIDARTALGYRKKAEGEWEAVINSYGLFIESCYICSSCKCEFYSEELPSANYCPNCGSKMKGGE